jgi:dienelactone hydrolase
MLAKLRVALDSITPAQRIATEAIFQTNNLTYQTALYAGAEHGFAVRTDLSIPQKKFAQESAYFQAVRFFDAWVKV